MRQIIREISTLLFALVLSFNVLVIVPSLVGTGLMLIGMELTDASLDTPVLPLRFLIGFVGWTLLLLAMLLLSYPVVIAGCIVTPVAAIFVSMWLDRKMRQPPVQSIEDYVKDR